MAAALSRQIPIVEYAPKKVKMSVTGNGNASKEQVAYMLSSLLSFNVADKLMDATDALAVAGMPPFPKWTASGVSQELENIFEGKPGSY